MNNNYDEIKNKNNEEIKNKNKKNYEEINDNKKEIITSIDDKYKNLENPFDDNSEVIKKKEDENKKKRIMDRIKKGRKNVQSHSVDNAYKKSDKIQRLANDLENNAFKGNNND